MVEEDAGKDAVDAFIEDVPGGLAAHFRADDRSDEIHGRTAEITAWLGPDLSIREQSLKLMVDGFHHIGEVYGEAVGIGNREAAADVEVGEMHMEGFCLIEKPAGKEQGFFVSRR